MNKKRKIIRGVLLAVFVFVTLGLLQRLLMPKYMGNVIEGAFIKEYYEETTSHDIVFLGDCEVYENISPIRLWEKYGYTSYIRGSANQLLGQSYYLLKDTLRHEKENPRVVVLSVLAMEYEEQTNEAYNRMTMEGMRWSKDKFDAIRETKMEEEHLIEYVFPILRYHSRWKELNRDDLRYFWKQEKVSHNGYYMRTDCKPAGEFPRERQLPDYEFGKNAYGYLDKITQLCKEEGISLVLLKAPSLYPAWHEQWEEQIERYASEHQLLYLNSLAAADEIGLDYQTDTYDGGLHLNLSGAEKLSDWLGGRLGEAYDLTDHRGEEALAAVWREKAGFYDEVEAAQVRELEEYGHILRFQNGQ